MTNRQHLEGTRPDGTRLEPGQRDPRARRRAIVDAAAALIVEHGSQALTHRAVAARAGVSLGSTTKYFDTLDTLRAEALAAIADEIDDEIADLARVLEISGSSAEVLAAECHRFLADEHQVRGTMALTAAAITDESLRDLAIGWDEKFVDLLSRYIDRPAAIALQMYLDGATAHVAVRRQQLPIDQLTDVVRALLTVRGATA